jgi:hypothetical protein
MTAYTKFRIFRRIFSFLLIYSCSAYAAENSSYEKTEILNTKINSQKRDNPASYGVAELEKPGSDSGSEFRRLNTADNTSSVTTRTVIITKEKKKKKKSNKKLKTGAKLHAGWTLEHKDNGDQKLYKNSFYIKKARVKLRWKPSDRLLGVIKADLAELADSPSRVLKDAYIQMAFADFAQLKAGQFKKPFSVYKLYSSSEIKTINRGTGNRRIVSDLNYGGRDIGVQLQGRIIEALRFDYSLGVFNGSGPAIKDFGNSKDIAARLNISPVRQLTLGINGTLKFIDHNQKEIGQPSKGFAGGADAKLKLKGFRFFTQALLAQDHHLYTLLETDADNPPVILDLVAVISYAYSFDTSFRFKLEPLFKFEFYEPQIKIADDTVWIFTPGINTYAGKYIRFMINGEFLRTSRNTLDSLYSDSEKIMALLCLDI